MTIEGKEKKKKKKKRKEEKRKWRNSEIASRVYIITKEKKKKKKKTTQEIVRYMLHLIRKLCTINNTTSRDFTHYINIQNENKKGVDGSGCGFMRLGVSSLGTHSRSI
jgi:hypothetical protein